MQPHQDPAHGSLSSVRADGSTGVLFQRSGLQPGKGLAWSTAVRGLLEGLTSLAHGVLAIVAALLPRRSWNTLSGLPIASLASASAALTVVAGVLTGVAGFFDYTQRAAGRLVDETLMIAARQASTDLPGASGITTAAPVALSALSIFAFLLFTPTGLLAVYLVATGVLRWGATFVDEPVGDPLLTLLDALVRRAGRRVVLTRRRRAREREEGPEVPDRLYTGAWAGLTSADCVVVSSRRKPDWNAGTFIITSDKWYTLGEPFDRRLPEGLRTFYPLTEQTTNEVLRRGVRYDLPPLQETTSRSRT